MPRTGVLLISSILGKAGRRSASVLRMTTSSACEEAPDRTVKIAKPMTLRCFILRVVLERGDLTVDEAAAALRVVPTTVLRLIHRKALAPGKHARAHHGLSVK